MLNEQDPGTFEELLTSLERAADELSKRLEDAAVVLEAESIVDKALKGEQNG